MRLGLSLGALAALHIAAGLAVQLWILRIVGAGWKTDAFFAAQAVPLVMLAILSSSLQHVWQARFAVAAVDASKWMQAQSAAQGQVLLTCGSASLFLALAAALWTPWLFPGFDEAQARLTVALALPLFGACALNCHSALSAAALRASGRFVAAEVTPLAGSVLLLVLVLVVVPRWGVVAAAWSLLARAVVVCLAFHRQAGRPAWGVRQSLAQGSLWQQTRLLVGGSSLYKTAPLIDRYWASQAGAGGLTALNLAQLAMSSVTVVLERVLCAPVLPQLARDAEQGMYAQVRAGYRRCVWRVSVATMALAVLLFLAVPVFEPLLVTALSLPRPLAAQVWLLLALLLGFMHVGAAGSVVTTTFMALGDARTPVVVGVVSFFAGAALKSFAFVFAGLPGLALATSAYYVVNMLVLCFLLERTIDARLS
jgi:putative peptidoglycan lipid II flippase